MRKIYIILAIILVLVITQVIVVNRQLVKQSVPVPVPAQPVATTNDTIVPANIDPSANKDSGDDKNGMHIGLIKDVSTDFIGLDYVQ